MKFTRCQRGFSMAELLMTIAVLLVIASLAIPSITQTIANYRLDASGHAAASLLQQARLSAVKNNAAFYAHYDTSTTPNQAYVDANPASSSFAQGDPAVQVDGNTVFQASGLPDSSQLTDYLGGTAIQAEVGTAIGFNPRGLPCMGQNTSGTLCQQKDPVSGSMPAFLWFMQNQSNGGWEAVTVTPAGRIKVWRMGTTDPTSKQCGYPVCWQ